MFALFFLSLSGVLLVPIHFSLRRFSSLELFFLFLSSLSFYFSLFHSLFIVQQHLSFPVFLFALRLSHFRCSVFRYLLLHIFSPLRSSYVFRHFLFYDLSQSFGIPFYVPRNCYYRLSPLTLLVNFWKPLSTISSPIKIQNHHKPFKSPRTSKNRDFDLYSLAAISNYPKTEFQSIFSYTLH